MRRALAVLASVGLGIGTIALATPAHAATQVACTSDENPQNPFIPPGSTLEFSPGPGCEEMQWVTGESSDFTVTVGDTNVSPNGTVDPLNEAQVVVTVSPDASDLTQFKLLFKGNGTTGNYFYLVGSPPSPPNPDSGSSEASGSAPAPEIQQFGLPASGNCEDGVTDAMNWSGIGTDGWGISWAQWMNEGVGGAVCTRTVMYDTAAAKWVVN